MLEDNPIGGLLKGLLNVKPHLVFILGFTTEFLSLGCNCNGLHRVQAFVHGWCEAHGADAIKGELRVMEVEARKLVVVRELSDVARDQNKVQPPTSKH